MRRNKGITLISLAVTIAIILILATISVHTGIEAYKMMQVQNFVAEMKVIQARVNQVTEEYDSWKENGNTTKSLDDYIESTISGAQKCTGNFEGKVAFENIISELNNMSGISSWQRSSGVSDGGDSNISNYYYFTSETLKSGLGVKDIEDVHVIINFHTRNVIERDGVVDLTTKKKIYRQYDTSSGEQLIQ